MRRTRRSRSALPWVVKVVNETGGSAAAVEDPEILDAIELLARTEGIFTEPAGGTTLAATRELIARGAIKQNESVVVCITGNGYKTAEVMRDRVHQPIQIGKSLADFERAVDAGAGAAAAAAGKASACCPCSCGSAGAPSW
jgi:threonine synthase